MQIQKYSTDTENNVDYRDQVSLIMRACLLGIERNLTVLLIIISYKKIGLKLEL